MDDKNVKTCDPCNAEKLFEILYKKHSECKACTFKTVSKRCYKNIMSQWKTAEISMHVLTTWILD